MKNALQQRFRQWFSKAVDCSNVSEDQFFRDECVAEMRVSEHEFAGLPRVDDRCDICRDNGRLEFQRWPSPRGRFAYLSLTVSCPRERPFVWTAEIDTAIREWIDGWGNLHKYHLQPGESHGTQWLLASLLVDPLALELIGRDTGGSAFVLGTRFRVSEIVAANAVFRWSPEVAREELYEQLSPQQMYSVFAYAWEHMAEIKEELNANLAVTEQFQNRITPALVRS